jgi:hypothetical protein
MLRHNPEHNQWNEVAKQDADFIHGHPRVMYCIECLGGKLEPPRVQSIHQAVRENKRAEPDEQDCIVDNGAPNQKFNECSHAAPLSRCWLALNDPGYATGLKSIQILKRLFH